MTPKMDLPQALIRGRYLTALAKIWANGIPLNVRAVSVFQKYGGQIQLGLIHRYDAETGFWNHWTRQLKYRRFESWLARRGYSWPQTATGRLELKKDTVRDMAVIYPELQRFAELKGTLGKMGLLHGLPIGPDGRNRAHLSPFGSITGRNQPSTREFILCLPKWTRNLIESPPGWSHADLDCSLQEVGAAGKMSGDRQLLEDYLSSDLYLATAIRAGKAPRDATKETHKRVRDLFKSVVLGAQYDMTAKGLERRIQQSYLVAKELIDDHHDTYRAFWNWSDSVLNYARLYGTLQTKFGWTLHVTDDMKSRTLRNFLVQGNCAEILRFACIFAVEAGVKVLAPNHDSLLIEAPTSEIEGAIAITQQAIRDASNLVLDGFEVKVSVKGPFDGRYRDPDHQEMWNTAWDIVADISPELARVAKECR